MAKAIRLVRQPFLPGISIAEAEATTMAESGIKERGAVTTRREVVDFILDLAEYTTDKMLYKQRLLEPSFGDGEFLLAAVEHLRCELVTAVKNRDISKRNEAVFELYGMNGNERGYGPPHLCNGTRGPYSRRSGKAVNRMPGSQDVYVTEKELENC